MGDGFRIAEFFWGRVDIVCGRDFGMIALLAILFPILFATSNAWSQQSRLIFEHPFIVAARAGNLQAVRNYLARGESPEVRDKQGQTPLMVAVQKGKLEMVEIIIAATKFIDIKDNQGNTALGLAVIHGYLESTELLLQAGASPNVPNRQGMTPLMLAAKHARVVVLEMMAEHLPDLTLRDYTGRGPLGWARQGRNSRIIRLLKTMGAYD